MSSPTLPSRDLLDRYDSVRLCSMRIAAPLTPEDFVIQSMPDASPTKWHLAHTTWFFETFVLLSGVPGYRVFHPEFNFLFNSYYNSVGARQPRSQRGMLSRPSILEVFKYREYVDRSMQSLLEKGVSAEFQGIIELGLQHEQQHQELMLTDIKHMLSLNPLKPAYRVDLATPARLAPVPLDWVAFTGGIVAVGHPGSQNLGRGAEDFHFDNEGPQHNVLLQDFEFANRLVSNAEYLEFIMDDGYQRPEFWLSEGWDNIQNSNWNHPLYWHNVEGTWYELTLGGERPLDDNAPVSHVSLFEADAYARWRGCRLPTEFEWETVARQKPVIGGNFAESDFLQPMASTSGSDSAHPQQLWGDVWEWTASPYLAYPGYKPAPGAIGEYNGKFMSSQWVLRGGSCATPAAHIRTTYRNFFHPDKRWQFTGIRLAK